MKRGKRVCTHFRAHGVMLGEWGVSVCALLAGKQQPT